MDTTNRKKKWPASNRLFYMFIGFLAVLIFVPVLAALLICRQILNQSEQQLQASLSNTLQQQLVSMQSSSPARQRTFHSKYLMENPYLSELAAASSMPRDERLRQIEARLADLSKIPSASTGQTAAYLYFVNSDYLMGSEISCEDARALADPHIFDALALVDPSDEHFSRTQYGYDEITDYYFTISISCLYPDIYYISVHSYLAEEGPTRFLPESFLTSFPEVEIAYYDSYGNHHTATPAHTLTDLYDFYTIGEEESGSFTFYYDHHPYLAFYVYNPDNLTKIALFCRNEISESRKITDLLLWVASAGVLIICLSAAVYALKHAWLPMDSRLKEQDSLLSQCYLLRLLRGMNTDMIESYRDKWLDAEGASFVVAAVHPEMLSINRFLPEEDLAAQITDYFTDHAYDLAFVPAGEYFYLIFRSFSEPLTAEKLAEVFACVQKLCTSSSFSVFLSSPVSSPAKLRQSYQEAMAAAEYCLQLEQYGRILIYADMPRPALTHGSSALDFSELSSLTRAISELSREDALIHYDAFLRPIQGFLGHPLTAEDQIFPLLTNTISLAFYDLTLPGDLGKNAIRHHMEQARQAPDAAQLRAVLADSLKEFLRRQDDPDFEDPSFQRILAYVNTHFSDPNLSSALISDHFGMSPSNITRIFKKYNHSGFLAYLHRLRVTEACRLLCETDLTVAEIAIQVGYSNTITMNRAFKNYANTTPGNFRRSRR